MSIEAIGAERAILSILIKSPELYFEACDVLSEADFTVTGNGLIFGVIKHILSDNPDSKLDRYIIFSEAEKLGVRDFFHHTLDGELVEALENSPHSKENFNRFLSNLKQASIKRALINTFDELKDDVELYNGHSIDLKNMVEDKVLNAVKTIDKGEEEVVNLSDDFEETINAYADNPTIGLDIGMPRFQKDVGKIRNGSITGLFARAKAGKSQFAMWAAYQTAIKKGLPVLYLDTELQKREQQMRLCGMVSKIPFEEIESGAWRSDKTKIQVIKDAAKEVSGSPLYYRNIAGLSVEYVIPTIRKFVYNQLGGPTEGNEPKGLVIYDYIKLMSAHDLERIKEWQLLGLLASNLHDCVVKYNIPMIALGQLNKDAYKIDSEMTAAGADRLVHNLDSFTILRDKKQEEIEIDGKMRGNSLLKVCVCRHGPGHDGTEWINLHFDKGSGQLQEDKRNSEVAKAVAMLEETEKFIDGKK